MIVGGDGITVDGAGNPANPIVITAKPVPLVVADSDCITLSGQGTTAAPLSAAPRLDPNPANLLKCGPGGLVVAGGTGGAVATGCGLTGDGSTGSPVTAATMAWPHPCDVDAKSGGVYCDSAGVLRSEPRTMASNATAEGSQAYPATLVPAGSDVVVLTKTLDMRNPDSCRPALAYVNLSIDVDFNLPANSSAVAGIADDDMQAFVNRGSSTATGVHTQVGKIFRRSIPAGGTLTEELPITMGRGTGGATYTRIQWSIRALIISV
ncbi:hypothetical protein OHA04_27740 [Streptomyces sp. NBC_01590]|uniref:hypothetical protein n=1 Tax=Streptomyces sp. NBC_01590 TaxID=2975887 RepID=UPI00386359BC